MVNKARIITIIITAMLSIIIISGCAELDITAGVRERGDYYEAFLQYEIMLDMTAYNNDMRKAAYIALDELGAYYNNELGFHTEVRKTDSTVALSAKRIVRRRNLIEAAEALKDIVYNEKMSVFSKADIKTGNKDEDNYVPYSIRLYIDPYHIYNLVDLNALNTELREAVRKGAEDSAYTVTISMPENPVAGNDERGGSSASMRADMVHVIEAELEGKAPNVPHAIRKEQRKATTINTATVTAMIFLTAALTNVYTSETDIYRINKKYKQ